MVAMKLPANVIPKPNRAGEVVFYWNLSSYDRKKGCTIPNEPLGTDPALAFERAGALNARLQEWRLAAKGETIHTKRCVVGTVAWLFQAYRGSDAYRNKVSARSRPDYERNMLAIEDTATTDGRTVGQLRIDSITPAAADKIVRRVIERIAKGAKGTGNRRGDGLRTGEKVVALAKRAWPVVHRLHPEFFRKDTPNPWEGVELQKRQRRVKPMVTRAEVYAFARGCIARGRPEPAAAAVVCFEWLQRPENVLAGYVRWPDYRPPAHPHALKITHHKTGAIVWHPLEEPVLDDIGNPITGNDGRLVVTRFYEEAEEIIASLPRRGVPMIMKAGDPAEIFTANQMGNLVRTMRGRIPGTPAHFSLDACRHGGMTELEEAGLTDGQGRALSGHRSRRAYDGYAKATMERALEATKKRRSRA
jgi:hypothetical protein